MSFAELVMSDSGDPQARSRRIRIYAPNVLDLESIQESIDEIELNANAGMVLEDSSGIVVGWLLPGERLTELELGRLHASRAHLIKLARRRDVPAPGVRAA